MTDLEDQLAVVWRLYQGIGLSVIHSTKEVLLAYSRTVCVEKIELYRLIDVSELPKTYLIDRSGASKTRACDQRSGDEQESIRPKIHDATSLDSRPSKSQSRTVSQLLFKYH
ncbi:hypothetical protein IHE49_10220 [Rhodanobacter sp. 7MK24]|nr:hypothetical protein [Rhodanobacter sp. 7MK24]